VRQPFEISLVLCVSQPAAIRGNLRFTKRGKLLKMIDNWMALRTLACRCLRGVFALFVAVLCLLSTAQAGVVNGDFGKWRFHGLDGDQLPQQRYCHIPAHPEKPSEFAASRYGPSDAGGERGIRHARECARRTRTAITIPFQGSYSARINARGNNNRASGIQQSAQIALADVDAVDGKVHLRMVVAPVIQITDCP